MHMRYTLAVVVGTSLLLGGVEKSFAQDKGSIPEAAVKPVFENDKVLVQEFHFAPGAISKSQPRPARLLYFFTEAHYKFTYPDGTVKTPVYKAGQVVWLDAETYEAKNVGKKPIRSLSIRMKQ